MDYMSAVNVANCADDAGAVNWAERTLDGHPSYTVVELWKEDRLVARRMVR